jgi:hypothetical protein
VRWEREDAAYAAATIVAAALVAYFVIGNFGLVPSPLAPRGLGAVRPIAVPSLQALGAGPRPTVTAVAVVPSVAAGPLSPAASPTPRPAASDRTPPLVAISTPGGTQVDVTQPAAVEGTATDRGTGVRDVAVTFRPASGGAPTVVPAKASCRDASRRDCTWSAGVPAIAGTYNVTARAVDRASNAATAGPIDITVVNAGGLVGTLTDGVGGLVGGVGGLLVR